MRNLSILLSALIVAACSGEPDPVPVASESTAMPATARNVPSVLPSETSEAAPAPTASEIPAAIRGRWGLVPADCTSTRGDNKGLLTVDAKRLRFFESIGELGKVSESSDTRLRAGFDFSGEGMDWTRDETFDVQDGGQTMIRREYGQDAAPGPFRYTRCPA